MPQNSKTAKDQQPDMSQGAVGSAAAPEMKKFSTFAGVFTPSILTILGVVMFMRAGFVVGHAGIYGALVILGLSKLISIFTALSISAIATNTDVRGGGAYFLISRTLGPEFGATIGLTLFLAQTLSVPFYILGFSEALVRTVPSFQPFFVVIAFVMLIVLFLITLRGADWAIKAQYVIMGILGLSILAFLSGFILKFDSSQFWANTTPLEGGGISFWALFALYFPAATGIMTGVNMSGDLKNPTKSIPRGTLAAIGAAILVYASQILLGGGAISRQELIENPYHSLISAAPFHTGLLVVLGVFCATLSSALGSLLGAPRVLQSLGQDKILKPINSFAKITAAGEPRRALFLTLVICLFVLFFARNGGDGGALNMVASVVTMFFLWTYGITNLAAFVESFSGNPSFRPRFKFFHWSPALVGAGACFAVSFIVNWQAAIIAALFFCGLFLYVRKFILTASFGDARRGFVYSRTKDNLFTLSTLPIHSKNWRPTIVAFSGDPQRQLTLVKYADWLGSGRGIVTLAVLVNGHFEKMVQKRNQLHESLHEFIFKNRIRAFPEVLVTPDFELGLNQFLQSTSIGPIKPNLALFGWSADSSRAEGFIKSIQTSVLLNMSVGLVWDAGIPDLQQQRKLRIDIWWRGMRNGSLMVILAYLLSLNPEWAGLKIRILRMVRDSSLKDKAYEDLRKLIEAARLDFEIDIVVSDEPFHQLLHRVSGESSVVFLGFAVTQDMDGVEFQKSYGCLLRGMPTTIMVHSTGEADLLS
ncbi:MAG: amino acid permease [Chitinispirillaceae bacterium]